MKAKRIASSICLGLGVFIFIISFFAFMYAYPPILRLAIDSESGGITDTAEPSLGQALVTFAVMMVLGVLNMASIGFFVTGCLMICPIICGDTEKRICSIILAAFSLLFIITYLITLFFL